MSLAAAWLRIPLAKRALILLGPPAVLFIGAVVYMILITAPSREFEQTDRRLELEQTQAQVEALFGRPVDYKCRFDDSEIWYYSSRGPYCGTIDNVAKPSGSRYNDLSDLPNPYDHAQLAFDRTGALHAYTRIGESLNVVSRRGQVPGSHFGVLPPDAF